MITEVTDGMRKNRTLLIPSSLISLIKFSLLPSITPMEKIRRTVHTV